MELSGDAYLWIKGLHVISVIAWMAGLLYLPRLYVYHVDAEPGSDKSETFKIMERRLMRGILNPSMMASVIFGLIMVYDSSPAIWQAGWFHTKLTAVIAMLVMHVFCGKWRRAFAEDRNTHSGRFYRFMNEVPAVLMVVIVLMVIVQPF
ncbi:MAG TPA: protoporphyrinogen oxidase HemJ [Rhodospirillaceae bacterium]|nr:protoporphyrinogen oxidase HemJ [Rhodospirillaceae bacterium]|tara:strand:- start:68 stop:514 length:447 start_codon:yes stop_codon:yes gene_type:complete